VTVAALKGKQSRARQQAVSKSEKQNMATPQPSGLSLPLGVYADSGEFLPPLDSSCLDVLRQEGIGGTLTKSDYKTKAGSDEPDFGVEGGETVGEDLSQSGWSVLYGLNVSDAIKKELQPLLDHRKNDVKDEKLFKIFDGPEGYQKEKSVKDWLRKHEASLQVVDPEKVPFYVLIVASPDDIPFEFQCELDLYYAVGRLWFLTPEEFAFYVKSVIDCGNPLSQVATSRQLSLFCTANQGDHATQDLYASLFDPLIQKQFGTRQHFTPVDVTGPKATKDALHNIFTGQAPGGTPALMFTGSHGLLQLPGAKYQAETQGAIVCYDWPGKGPVGQTQCYAAWDLKNPKVHGMVLFMLACYGGGWPQFDSYQAPGAAPVQISTAPMMARLPQRLLGCENGALAVIGHVDKAWSYSYHSSDGIAQPQSFRDVFLKLMFGLRLGNATDQFNLRCAGIAEELLDGLESLRKGDGEYSPEQVLNLRVAHEDSRNYVVFGDPAVRLCVKPASTAT
jgi:hypothetical protein